MKSSLEPDDVEEGDTTQEKSHEEILAGRTKIVAWNLHSAFVMRPKFRKHGDIRKQNFGPRQAFSIFFSEIRSTIFFNGYYLSNMYLVFKLLCLLQTSTQFLLMNQFLSPGYTFWGFGILVDILQGREWMDNGHFPR
jgi:hypothetical protein